MCKKVTVSFYSSRVLPGIVQMFNHYTFFTSSMWPRSSCGSPSSDTRSMQRCTRWFTVPLELEEQSVDQVRGFCCWWGTSKSIFSPLLQQSVSLHPSPQQPESGCFRSRSSIVSDTELTLGGTYWRPSMIVFSYCSICCRRSHTEAGMGLPGYWIWHQHDTALWRDTKRQQCQIQWQREVSGTEKSL